MYFDYHIHSNFSADSEETLEEICRQSMQKGFTEIAITDHNDIDYQDPTITFQLDRSAYLQKLEELQKTYRGKLRIKKGLELGMQPHILDRCREFVGDDFDFVICSFHTTQKKDLYTGDFFTGYTQWEAYRQYLQEILFCVEHFDHFSVLGHLDVIRRYGGYTEIPQLTDDSVCYELLVEIFRTIIAKGKGIEVNTSGYYISDGQNPMPSVSILRLYHDLGGQILTMGSDSHRASHIGYKFKQTYDLLRQLGFTCLTTFEKGEPMFHQL